MTLRLQAIRSDHVPVFDIQKSNRQVNIACPFFTNVSWDLYHCITPQPSRRLGKKKRGARIDLTTERLQVLSA